jgi:aminoglycoside 6'-N-acetyltransferase I
MVRSIKPEDWAEWLRMRLALWPHHSKAEHEAEMAEILSHPQQMSVFVSLHDGGGLDGFIEVSLRPFAEKCRTRPVGYIEGWYVDPNRRQKTLGRALVVAAEEWARSKGCREMASDTKLDNEIGQQAHRRLGYTECTRLVHFRKDL